jgi:hypothetical protein
MPASPERATFADWLVRVQRRLRLLAAVRGAAWGLLAAALARLAGGDGQSVLMVAAVTAALVAIGAAGAVLLATRVHVASLVEHRAPASRNLVFTAAELIAGQHRTSPPVSSRVLADASAFASRLDLSQIIPARGAVASAAIAAILWISTSAVLAGGWWTRTSAAGPSSASAATVSGIDVTITPPGYTGRPVERLHDPVRITAFAGSRLDVTVIADAAAVTVETIDRTQALGQQDGRAFVVTLLADADGFLAFAPTAANGSAGARRLIGLSVTPDRPPAVRITDPGKDMLLTSGVRTLSVGVEADDDLALASLKLRYTRVAGSGETFTFTEGDVPVVVAQTNDRAWTARASWPLGALALEPGDMLIYRGVATDRRPGAPAAESNAFIVEIAAPGAVPSEGFGIDDRQDKYAISQQMVILNTERLLARRPSMTPADYQREAEGIAAEQRQVRAEFVFMMGGELADFGLDSTTLNEEVEAAGESDLAAGRMANQGRADLIRAIRSMSRAAARLADPDLARALPIEKEALTFLQRAFSRSRYILRTLSERERLDLSRRLTGTLAALDRETRPAALPPPSPRVAAIRRVLADLGALSADANRGAPDVAARATALAEQVLRIDPSSPPLRDVATAIAQASWDRAATALAAIARAELPAEPARGANPRLDALAGALADALRRAGGR